jgi:ubiquitin-like modifier-activating enzyme ATG7
MFLKVKMRTVKLKGQLDASAIAENAASLNLKLMKWRMAPDLNLEAIN